MPNKFNIPIRFESMVPDFPEQTVVMARKLGLLRKQEIWSQPTKWARRGDSDGFAGRGGDASPCNMFRSRTRA